MVLHRSHFKGIFSSQITQTTNQRAARGLEHASTFSNTKMQSISMEYFVFSIKHKPVKTEQTGFGE